MVRKPARNSQTTLLCAMPLRRNDPTIHARLLVSIGRNWMKIFRTKASSHINTPFFPFFNITFFIFRAYLREIIELIGAKNLTPHLRVCLLFGAVSPNQSSSFGISLFVSAKIGGLEMPLSFFLSPLRSEVEGGFSPSKTPSKSILYINI